MIILNTVNRGMDDSTLEYVLKSMPPETLDDLLKSYGFEVRVTDGELSPLEYTPISKSEIFDLIKATKVKAGAKQNSHGKFIQKVRKRILCHNSKTGAEYFQMRTVNADVAEDAPLQVNVNKEFDEHVARVRYEATSHLTEEAANITDMMSTPEGKAALDAINAAIGSRTRNGKLSKGLNYTNIRYCTNPVKGVDEDGKTVYHGCLAIAKNPNTGKDMYFYSQQFQEKAEAERTQRALIYSTPMGQAWIEETLESSEFANEDVRDCLKLMYSYGMKTGNELASKKNQMGDYVTTGATTLTAENVHIEKKRVKDPETGKTKTVEKVFLQFYQQGEKGDMTHQQSIEITDPALADRLRAKKEAATSDSDRIFSCTKDDTLAVCKNLFECNCEDLRTSFGFRKGREASLAILGKNPFEPKKTTRINRKTGKREKMTAKRAEMEIAEYLMEELGVTDKRMVDKYINKNLIQLFSDKPKEKAKKEKEKKAAAKKAAQSKKPTNPKGNGPKKTS